MDVYLLCVIMTLPSFSLSVMNFAVAKISTKCYIFTVHQYSAYYSTFIVFEFSLCIMCVCACVFVMYCN